MATEVVLVVSVVVEAAVHLSVVVVVAVAVSKVLCEAMAREVDLAANMISIAAEVGRLMQAINNTIKGIWAILDSVQEVRAILRVVLGDRMVQMLNWAIAIHRLEALRVVVRRTRIAALSQILRLWGSKCLNSDGRGAYFLLRSSWSSKRGLPLSLTLHMLLSRKNRYSQVISPAVNGLTLHIAASIPSQMR